jgi:hypothetical protein
MKYLGGANMAQQDFLRQTLEYYRQQLKRKRDEILPLELTVRQLELELGEAGSEPLDLSGLVPVSEGSTERRTGANINGRSKEIRPDQFYGMSISDAARQYLTGIGHAVAIEELIDALKKGGCKLSGQYANKVVYTALIRNTKDFTVPQQGYVGLRSFYPNLKAGAAKPVSKGNGKGKAKRKAKAKKGSQKAKGAGTTRRSVPKAQPASDAQSQSTDNKAEQKPTVQSVPVKEIVREILSDGKLHTGKSIVEAVQAKGGTSIKAFTIYGVLSRKPFEKVGEDQFQLVK